MHKIPWKSLKREGKGIYSANANFPNDNCDYNDEKLRY